MSNKVFDLSLYLVLDPVLTEKLGMVRTAELAVQGGATIVQLRAPQWKKRQRYECALKLKTVLDSYHVPLIIDDDIDIALAVDADGVHVGQSDMEAGDVRAKLGPDKIIGVSAQTVEQAVLAEKRGADYLGVGAVFPTNSKDDATDVSYETLKAICQAVSIPVIAIGGITKDNVEELSGSGICGIAVISAIYGQKNIKDAAANLKMAVKKIID